jgi:peptidyl-prolyl cis-trans isomerase SurA
MTPSKSFWRPLAVAALATVLTVALGSVAAQGRALSGDYIAAIVNQEVVTAGEIERRLQRAQQDAARAGARLPPERELRGQVLDLLIEERVIVTHARDSGVRVDEPELDRAVQSVAAQNQLTLDQLRERLRADGIDYARFRASLRDQMLIERVREREVYQRIRIDDADVDRVIEQQRAAAQVDAPLNIAQILVAVPEGADAATENARRARAEAALARVRGGEDFAAVAREISEDGNRERGGEIGLRPASRLPDIFVEAVRGLPAGAVRPTLVRSGAGFHVLKVVERGAESGLQITQTRSRHILLRTSPQLSAEVASRRLADSGARSRPARAASKTWRASSPRTARRRPAANSAGPRPARWCPSSSRR